MANDAGKIAAPNVVLGYVNVYRHKDGTVLMGSTDLYESAEEARVFDASEFDDAERSVHIGIAAVILNFKV